MRDAVGGHPDPALGAAVRAHQARRVAAVHLLRRVLVTGDQAPPAHAGRGDFDPADPVDFARADAYRFDGPLRGQARG